MTREEKMAKRRENGKCYVYKPNPYTKGTDAWEKENTLRIQKSRGSKTPVARMMSCMKKVENNLTEEKQRIRNRKKTK